MSGLKCESNYFQVSDELFYEFKEIFQEECLYDIENILYKKRGDLIVKIMDEYYEWTTRNKT